MAVHQVYPSQYRQQLASKIERTTAEFAHICDLPLTVFDSPPSHYRMRAEFKIWHQNGRTDYAMFEPGRSKRPIIIEEFPAGSAHINRLMPLVLQKINNHDLLRQKLFQIEFLTSTLGDAVVTFIYHRALDDEWQHLAQKIANELQINIVGRSRKQKVIIGKDYVEEEFSVGGQRYRYRQVENAFSQPNAAVCQHMLNWVTGEAATLGGDLLELYCGNGNFTLPLSRQFNRVLATEIAKSSVATAVANAAINKITNIDIVRMSSEEFTQAYEGERPFRRLRDIDLTSFDFSTIFVDPPRAGLDSGTLALASRFSNILYVSCNPETLRENVEALSNTHEIRSWALFDQFPYTDHRECGMLLSRR